MTGFQISGTRGDVGRRGKNDHDKNMVLRFPPGLREAFDYVLKDGENRTNVIQAMIEAEVERRGWSVERELRRRGKSDE